MNEATEMWTHERAEALERVVGLQRRVMQPGTRQVRFERAWSMPSGDTFDMAPAAEFVWEYLNHSRVSVDPFARNKRWATFTNDLNPDTTAEHHMDAAAFLAMLEEEGIQPDLIIFDPPYSKTQAKVCYDGIGADHLDLRDVGHWRTEKAVCQRILKPGGVFLHFGWHTNGMGKRRGFEIEHILMIAHGGPRYDTICMAERKTQTDLFGAQREAA